ncbi:MAG: ABC transporter permease [Micrococcales bacterium]|nr:ABC transporter permease [Micrococcales bacterium]
MSVQLAEHHNLDAATVDLAKAPRSWAAPIAYSVITVFGLAAFWFGTTAGETTRLAFADDIDQTRSKDFIYLPVIQHLPSKATILALMLICAAVTTWSWWTVRGRQRTGLWLPIVFGVAWVGAFLIWVAAGKPSATISITSLLQSSLFLAVPLVFGSASGLICERVGVINISIEGQLLAGAFLAAVVGSAAGNPYWGLLAAPVAGALVGALLAVFAVRYWVDNIIVGVVLNVLVIGLTTFLLQKVLRGNASLNTPDKLPVLDIPVLSRIPVIGPVLFRQNLLVYLMMAGLVFLHIWLFRSRWGLRLRACGEHPWAAGTVGIRVNRTRVINTIIGGAVAGLGGAFLTLGPGLGFEKEISAGKGYIALAAMILGRWNPKGALSACLMFGFATALQQNLGVMGSTIPTNLMLMLPYAVTIFAVAGLVGRVRPPAAEGIAYKG